MVCCHDQLISDTAHYLSDQLIGGGQSYLFEMTIRLDSFAQFFQRCQCEYKYDDLAYRPFQLTGRQIPADHVQLTLLKYKN